MAKLILKFDDRVVKECVIGMNATIGRLRDNTVILDNPAVSGHHARIFHDGERFVLEDLKSKNGTFVNGKVVLTRRTLQDGDVVLVGRHTLVFDEALLVNDAEPVLEELGDTVYLDTPEHRAHLARLRAGSWGKRALAEPANEQPAAEPPEPIKVGVLHVLLGRAEQKEYTLEAASSLIGRSPQALVRLRGWFKPEKAAAIVRNDAGYALSPVEGRALLNHKPMRKGSHALNDGDILEVGGLVMRFDLR